MQRYARVLRLREGAEQEYERYHSEVWPEVVRAVEDAAIANYSIFRYGCWLFSYFELPDGITLEDVGRVMAKCEACQRWEETMHDLQEPLPESQGDNWWVPMKQVWHHY